MNPAPRANWHTMLQWAAVAGIVEYLILMGLVERSIVPPALVIAVVLLVGVILLRRTGRAGVRTTTVGLALFLVVNVVFGGPDLVVAASFGSFAVTWTAVATGVVGLTAGIASWRRRAPGPAVARVGLAGLGAAFVAVVVGLIASIGFTDAKRAPNDVAIIAKGNDFTPTTLTAPQGRTTFFLDNTDNTLHNFHINSTSGTENMPANHKVRFTVTLAPGTYEFLCDLHSDMKGTLTVS
jgi:plastocyanin